MLLYQKALYSQIMSVCGTIQATSATNVSRNALQVRRFPGGSALPPALESVKIRCEIFEISKLKNRLGKRTPRGYQKYLEFSQMKF